MKEYIEQNESICRSCFHSYVCEQFNEHRNSLNEKCHFYNDHFVSAADVVERKRGEWVFEFSLGGSNFYSCSVCGRQEPLLEEKDIHEWCPFCHCGADMRSHQNILCDQTEEVEHEAD